MSLSPFDALDRMWEHARSHSRRLQAADQTDDQSHVHHALVTVLLFGSLGAGLGLLLGRTITAGLRWGYVAGWVFYTTREILNRTSLREVFYKRHSLWRWRIAFDWRWKPWDGVCDVLVPLWVTAPVVFQSPVLLWVLSLCVALAYLAFRPLP